MKVIAAAQPGSGRGRGCVVSAGAGRGVNEQWRHTRAVPRVLVPGWLQLTDLWPPLPQNRSVTFRKVKPPSLMPVRLGG